jgi:hypothetical protein
VRTISFFESMSRRARIGGATDEFAASTIDGTTSPSDGRIGDGKG